MVPCQVPALEALYSLNIFFQLGSGGTVNCLLSLLTARALMYNVTSVGHGYLSSHLGSLLGMFSWPFMGTALRRG